MSMTGLEVFDTTVQKTNSWLQDLMQILDWPDRHVAYMALRATLHALRDRLSVEEVAHLGAQFPMLIRGFYYEGWNPTDKPLRVRHKEQFLAHIEQELRGNDLVDDQIAVERIAQAVFIVLEQRVSMGEINDVRHVLPAEIQELWP
jgi:uncharacterized protein (DUF2267 family)